MFNICGQIETAEMIVLFLTFPHFSPRHLPFPPPPIHHNHSAAVEWTFDATVPSQTCGDVALRTFDPLSVRVSIDRTDVQHQKMLIELVDPVVPGFSITPDPSDFVIEDNKGKKDDGKKAIEGNDAAGDGGKGEPPCKKRKS